MKSEEAGLGKMMNRYIKDTTQWIAENIREREGEGDETEEEKEEIRRE